MKLDGEALAWRAQEASAPAASGLATAPLPLRPIAPSPCNQACPAGINVKAYVSSIAEGRFLQALDIVRERCPLPGVCGRVCTHPCELACRRADVDEPVAIRALKRFVADIEEEVPWQAPPIAPERGRPVAVVGSGPAGLTAAYDLRRAGFPVTIFEGEDDPGGMLRHGIATYRLPRAVLDREIAGLLATGIELRTGSRLGRDVELEALLHKDYDAVLLAVGNQLGRGLGVPDEKGCAQVRDALAFLRETAGGARPEIGRRVVVVGGGSTAVEAARTARRLGAESVEIVYRRSRAEMPADEEELVAAEAEGIGLRLLTAPARVITGGGRLAALECLQVELGAPDESGRRRPVAVEGSEFALPADLVLAAVGQRADLGFLPGTLATRLVDRGNLAVDDLGGATRLSGVFAAGDVTGGPATIVHAIGMGHAAAEAIRRYLERGVRDPAPPLAVPPPEHELVGGAVEPASRRHPAMSHRLADPTFPEVERRLDFGDAVAEAQRCLRCGPCSECRTCSSSCHHRHAGLRPPGEQWDRGASLVRLRAELSETLAPGRPLPGVLAGAEGDGAAATVELLPAQNRILEERCRGCLLCAEVCSFDAIHAVPAAGGGHPRARIEALACRGCGLCTAVCPTAAAVPWTLAPGAWEGLTLPRTPAPAAEGSAVVLTCHRRAPSGGGAWAGSAGDVEIRTQPCVGQVTSGEILELLHAGAGRVVLVPCARGSCRFGGGPELAAAQAREARDMLALLGGDPERVVRLSPGASPIPGVPIPATAGAQEGGHAS